MSDISKRYGISVELAEKIDKEYDNVFAEANKLIDEMPFAIGEKIVIKNQVRINGKIRVNKVYLKMVDEGKLFMSVRNGKTRDGEERNCTIMLDGENLILFKKWLDENS